MFSDIFLNTFFQIYLTYLDGQVRFTVLKFNVFIRSCQKSDINRTTIVFIWLNWWFLNLYAKLAFFDIFLLIQK